MKRKKGKRKKRKRLDTLDTHWVTVYRYIRLARGGRKDIGEEGVVGGQRNVAKRGINI